MSTRCRQCSASTVWDDNVTSAVCTSCGSLADSSQSLLTSSHYGYQNGTLEPSLWDPSASTTLKSLRAGKNWDLAGQGKESRDRKNSYAIAEFIKSLAVSLDASGLSPRAITLFNQVKSANSFRWGQKSRSVAAACLAIALRESNRPDLLRDIALVADVAPTSISREFMAITLALNLTLPLVDPSVHVPILQAHVASALLENQQEPGLPFTLIKPLRALCLRSVANIATSLGEVFVRLSPDHDVLRLPVPSTACAIFIIALEAENRSVLNPLNDLAQYLGSRCHVSKSVVMARYKSIQEVVASWVEMIPWLDKYESKNGRAKISKRLIVARGLKDVIRFHEDIWQQKVKPTLELELGLELIEEDRIKSSEVMPPPSKRPKLNNAISHATQFLLNPTGTSISSNQKRSTSTFLSHLSLVAHILTTPTASCVYQAPTRLQLLAQDRGGVGEAQIPDDDLFVEGELEKLLRSDVEIATLRETLGWKEDEEGKFGHSTTAKVGRKKRKLSDMEDEIIHGTALSPRKKSRVNMEALALFMASHEDSGRDINDDFLNVGLFGVEEVVHHSDDDHFTSGLNDSMADEDDDPHLIYENATTAIPQHRHHTVQKNGSPLAYEEEVVLRTWRPPTPDHIILDSRYDEEYD
ncbi:hypothetical protein CVT25_015748 [Psilocybe cyanescens]|uniref:Transcription factor TFIIB cyclin-like domain-containing protein n=1 Tax=Psilocybe cyanescens TaxID=93625 RepID=A0A409WRT7_PSICY|nr:hypothetical protein CVT25_015748 [Psilocybe cyanescens]